MSWLKRIQPVILHQSSDTPYVILEDGIVLCFNNTYSDFPEKEKYNLSFKVNRYDIKRTSSHYFEMKNFPSVIPFGNVISYDNTVLDGKIIKQAITKYDDSRNISLIMSSFISKLNDQRFNDITEVISNSDYSFLLTGKNLDPQTRLLGDIVSSIIYHNKDWGRTCVNIVDHVCDHKNRRYCWTKSSPDLNISCYGLKNADDMSSIQDTLQLIGLNDFAVTWETFED